MSDYVDAMLEVAKAEKWGVWARGWRLSGEEPQGFWARKHGGDIYVGTLEGARGYASYCNATCGGGPYEAKLYLDRSELA